MEKDRAGGIQGWRFRWRGLCIWVLRKEGRELERGRIALAASEKKK